MDVWLMAFKVVIDLSTSVEGLFFICKVNLYFSNNRKYSVFRGLVDIWERLIGAEKHYVVNLKGIAFEKIQYFSISSVVWTLRTIQILSLIDDIYFKDVKKT